MNTSTGALMVHSVARAVSSHVEWAVNRVLGAPMRFRWVEQPAREGVVRTELHWEGPAGSASTLASTLAGWGDIRFEITEDPQVHTPGVHIAHTPSLGLRTNHIDHAGNFTVNEHELKSIIAQHAHDATALVQALETALGTPWEIELEPYRRGEPVGELSWLTQVG